MPPVTFDAQCLNVGDRRRWIVGGAIDYTRVPRSSWEDRVRAARHAGLNCIVVPVVWSRHEASQGKLDFKGELALGDFVRIIGGQGLMCILRPGPFIGFGHDKGGLPAWLEETPDLSLRSANPGFLEAAARYLGGVVSQVKSLQASQPKAGPIVLVQNEHRWFCGDGAVGDAYLGEIGRYLRESGISTPMFNTNNLFHGVEGEIDAWNGYDGLFAILRQLRTIRPDQPTIVSDFELAQPAVWGAGQPEAHTPHQVLHRLAQAFASGAHVTLGPFHGGTNFGFEGGRLPFVREGYLTSSFDAGAPLNEAGERTPLFYMLKRICTFASHFERIFVALSPSDRHATINPAINSTGIVDCPGQQGSIIWAFRQDTGRTKAGKQIVDVTLADGSPMSIDLSGQPVGWCIFDALLHERAVLDWCSFNAFARAGRVFVCFAPAGAEGSLSINGSDIAIEAPRGKSPTILDHEGVTVVVCNEEIVDATFVTDEAVYVGASGLNENDEPIAHADIKRCIRIGADGEQSTVTAETTKRKPAKPSLGEWRLTTRADYVAGESDRFATIDGPATLDALGAPYGYGWMRLEFNSGSARTLKVGAIQFADRLHINVNGKHTGVLGLGPGAESENQTSIRLRKGRNVLTFLVDNLGRASGGIYTGEKKGLWGHLYSVQPLKAGRVRMDQAEPISPLSIRSPLTRLHHDDRTRADRPTWEFMHRKKAPIAICLDVTKLDGVGGVIIVNDAPVHIFGEGGWDRVLLDENTLRRGKNVIQLAFLEDIPDLLKRIGDAVTLLECSANIADNGTWGFAKWETPDDADFVAPSKSEAAEAVGSPAWWRTTFEAPETNSKLYFDASGLTKGQLFLNGRNVSRYWVAESDRRKKVNGQSEYYLPEDWLNPDGENVLTIFDEHGADPGQCRLVYL